MILLDTDVMVDILRDYGPAVTWLDSLGDEQVALPGFVAMELVQGSRNKAEQDRVLNSLSAHSLEWPSPETCEQALRAFTTFHLSHGLGMLDALIGQIAVAMKAPLCTFNAKHYEPLRALRTVQPYKKAPLT